MKRPKILYPPTIDWTLLYQRPQEVLTAFAEAGYDCYFMNANPPYAGAENITAPVKVADNITVLPPLYDPARLEDFILYYSHPMHRKWQEDYEPILTIYDNLDWPPDDSWLPGMRSAIENADVVFSASKVLHDIALNRHKKHSLYIPNGLNFKFFNENSNCELPDIIRDAKETDTPVIGYSGVIGEGMTDWSLFLRISEYFADCEFVLTGAFFNDYGELPDNMHFLGHLPRYQLPAVIKSFDVGVIPFENNAFSRAMSPLKLFEYCAGGIPVVSTPIPEVEDSWVAYIGRDDLHFIERLELALDEKGPTSASDRIKFASTHDWQTILEPAVSEIDDLLGEKNLK